MVAKERGERELLSFQIDKQRQDTKIYLSVDEVDVVVVHASRMLETDNSAKKS